MTDHPPYARWLDQADVTTVPQWAEATHPWLDKRTIGPPPGDTTGIRSVEMLIGTAEGRPTVQAYLRIPKDAAQQMADAEGGWVQLAIESSVVYPFSLAAYTAEATPARPSHTPRCGGCGHRMDEHGRSGCAADDEAAMGGCECLGQYPRPQDAQERDGTSQVQNEGGIRRMDIKEFREHGYLQEVNRRFLHPLGLALEVQVNDDGTEQLGGVWDYRDDPDGIRYDLGLDLTPKADNIAQIEAARRPLREAAAGYWIQPADHLRDRIQRVKDALEVKEEVDALRDQVAEILAELDRGAGVRLIGDERARQIEEEGYTPEHDAEHDGDLVQAAICYGRGRTGRGSALVRRPRLRAMAVGPRVVQTVRRSGAQPRQGWRADRGRDRPAPPGGRPWLTSPPSTSGRAAGRTTSCSS